VLFSILNVNVPDIDLLHNAFLQSFIETGFKIDGTLDAVPTDTKGTFFSFFSGSGFLDLGFEREGYMPLLVNEFDPSFLRAYRHSRCALNMPPPTYGYLQASLAVLLHGPGREWLSNRIVEARALGLPVGFIGGPPCPDFSNAGLNRGKDGSHGRLTRVYVDLIRVHQPDFFVFENVAGLMRKHASHLREIEALIGGANYRFATRLANGLEYGVPQDRERVVIIGFHKRLYQRAGMPVPRRQRLPDAIWQADLLHDVRALKSLPWPTVSPFQVDGQSVRPEGIREDLTIAHWFAKNQVEDHPNAAHCFQPRRGLTRMLSTPEGDVGGKSGKRLHRWRYSVTAAYGNNEVHFHPFQARRMSVAEVLAIQSMPKEFELPTGMPLSHMFKTVANGVPLLMAQGIARTVGRTVAALKAQNTTERQPVQVAAD
jgi:DNA (cytosine-5)-methyltransferase 1